MAWQVEHNEVTATSVARSLNKRGIKGKLGGLWRSQGVLRTIKNKFHIKRNEFDIPEWWGDKVWHRKMKLKKNKKIKKTKMPKVWTTDNLNLKK